MWSLGYNVILMNAAQEEICDLRKLVIKIWYFFSLQTKSLIFYKYVHCIEFIVKNKTKTDVFVTSS